MESAQFTELIRSLTQTVATVGAADLPELAKMHGWCMSLAEAVDTLPELQRTAVRSTASGLTATLEQLILGDAADAAAALMAVQEEIGQLATLAANQVVSTSPIGLQQRAEAESGPKCVSSPATPPPITDVEPYVAEPLTLEPNTEDFLKAFIDEAQEHIASIETALLSVEESPDDTARIDELFRPFHTIKGGAGFLSLRDINRLTHEAESLLDQGRKGQRSMTRNVIDIVFEVVDMVKQQVGCVAQHLRSPQGAIVPQPPVADLIVRLRRMSANRPAPPASAVAPDAGPSAGTESAPSTRNTATEPSAATPATPSATSPRVASAASVSAAADQSVRIDIAKLDALIDMVGELVIAQAQTVRRAQSAADMQLINNVQQCGKLIREVQGLSMSMRMIHVGPTFQKMARLVRDLSRQFGKQVEMRISGEETELDRNVIQLIGDPLVHMIRNAVDHGLESTEQRRAAGKSDAGIVRLSAFHHAGNVVIEVSDDGRGLDPKRLIAKAVERGVVRSGDELSDQQAYDLIFAAGFSTAEKVTDVSGRGVGMDVVRRNIEALRGRVEIRSELGKGTTFSIRLPLTLAIIDGMVVRLGRELYIIPTVAIEQSLRPAREQITSVQNRGEMLNVRGRLIPLMQLAAHFDCADRIDPCKNMVVIVNADGGSLGLVVQELVGQQQVVIKSLGSRFAKLRGISGAAILGDGRVGLILEMSGLIAAHGSMRPRRSAAIRASIDSAIETLPGEKNAVRA